MGRGRRLAGGAVSRLRSFDDSARVVLPDSPRRDPAFRRHQAGRPLADRQIRAISRHKSSKVLSRYVKRTQKQIIDATKKRRANRPAPAVVEDDQLDLFGRGKGKGSE